MNNLLVLQSDFGLVDGAVSAMIGVALEESPTLKIHHLTHDITPYNILHMTLQNKGPYLGSFLLCLCSFYTSFKFLSCNSALARLKINALLICSRIAFSAATSS